MGVWNLSSFYDSRYKQPVAGAPAISYTGVGYSNNTNTGTTISWQQYVGATDTCVIAVVSVNDTSVYQGPDERTLTARFAGQPMTLVAYQDECAVFLGLNNGTAGNKYITVKLPTPAAGTTPSYFWAANSASFTNSDGITNVVTNPASYPSTMNYPLTASITSRTNSLTVFCTGQINSNDPYSLSGGATQQFWTRYYYTGTSGTGWPAVGMFTMPGTGSTQSFSINGYSQGSVVAFSLIWTP